jgi:hypothetical protein
MATGCSGLGGITSFFVWGDSGLNSGFFPCKVGTLQLEPQLQSILLRLFCDGVS